MTSTLLAGVMVPVGVFLLLPVAVAFFLIAAYGMMLWVKALLRYLLQPKP